MLANFVGEFVGMPLFYVSFLSVLTPALAWYQIHLLGSLSERLEQFDAENKRLKESVDTFREQNNKLKNISDNLAAENEKFEAELGEMKNTLAGLETVRATLETY